MSETAREEELHGMLLEAVREKNRLCRLLRDIAKCEYGCPGCRELIFKTIEKRRNHDQRQGMGTWREK